MTGPVFLGAMSLPHARLLKGVGVAAGAGALLAVLGPFGTYLNPGLIARAAYWIAATLIGFVLYGAAFAAVGLLAPPERRYRWPVLLIVTLLAGIAETAITRALAFWLWPDLMMLELPWSLWFAQVSVFGLIAMGIAERAYRRRLGPSETTSPRDPFIVAPHRRLLPGNVLALQMEDHYVRVHTPQGSDLVLMPLTRAMESVDIPGLRIHRSWWVARDAVVSIEGTLRAMRLHLSNGVVAPVARSAVIHLKDAGWLSRNDPTRIRAASEKDVGGGRSSPL